MRCIYVILLLLIVSCKRDNTEGIHIMFNNKMSSAIKGYNSTIIQWQTKHIEESKNELSYIFSFIGDYFKYGHDNTLREIEADKGSEVFNEFYNFTINTNGYNALEELFNSNKTEELKIQIIDKWWKEYEASNK